ncbi:class I adenylate-forming enzyme family protein [Bradyrhizobium brasilense]|uniref:class I adenylate-forming enzyme family protein n=1 Tax=Bradyrhizobium brasilense TaxID=1419277 RepID=UPI001F32A481|nr:class I adenylate-forming enzyme family protein [Bradyrhizobium brasilense]
MTPLTQNRLHDRVSDALRRLEALESTYESITVGQLISMRAITHSSTTAIDIFERREQATYAEMDRQSNRYGHALRAFGVRKGDRIGVMLPNRIEFPFLFFAIAKLGAVLVPINMRFTSREVEYVLSDTRAKFAIVDESVRSVFLGMKPWPQGLAKERIIGVGQSLGGTNALLSELPEDLGDSPVVEDIGLDDLLCIAYTSGTTGFPKGCMLTHDWFGVSSYDWANFDSRPYDRYLCWSPFFYILWPMQFLKTYRQGGTLYQAEQLSSTRFIDWIERFRIEWCLLPELVARQAQGDALKSLKQVGYSLGWSPQAIRLFRERFGVRGSNIYGMVEIGMGTQSLGDVPEMEGAGSLGHRGMFRELRLVSDDGSPTPVGEIGELWVRGRGIFKGYWNKPEANATQFQGEWFKTGDLMRRNELGYFWFEGRKKDMIRRSNENIAAHEVEAIIRDVPEIEDVAAVPVRDLKRGEEVKIWVELKEGFKQCDLLVEQILKHARVRLAGFKVPRYIAFIPKLPRTTSSDKVLKRELTSVSDPLAGAYDTEERRWR